MDRHFLFSASFLIDGGFGTSNFWQVRDDGKFPSLKELAEVVEARYKGRATSIVILSICELSKADYNSLFEK